MPGSTARMLRADLKHARRLWIEDSPTDEERAERQRSDSLQYEDSSGRKIDFHATRHTYVSGIVAGNPSVKVAQELARHSDPRLTIGRYAHTRIHDLAGALESLPGEPLPPGRDTTSMKATGTDDHRPHSALHQAQQSGRDWTRSGAKACDEEGLTSKKRKSPRTLKNKGLGESERGGAAASEKRRRPDSNRGCRICNPMP